MEDTNLPFSTPREVPCIRITAVDKNAPHRTFRRPFNQNINQNQKSHLGNLTATKNHLPQQFINFITNSKIRGYLHEAYAKRWIFWLRHISTVLLSFNMLRRGIVPIVELKFIFCKCLKLRGICFFIKPSAGYQARTIHSQRYRLNDHQR